VVAASAQANLISNGSFDTDLSGWTQSGSLATTWDTGTAHVGRPGTPGTSNFFQDFFVPLGSGSLTVAFDYEWQINPPTLEDFFSVVLTYESTSGTVTDTLVSQGSATALFNQTVSFSETIGLAALDAASPNARLRFTLQENNANAGTRIQLDNVDVTAAARVPEPATLALVGLALFAAGAARRRMH
jgi:hypothetical protein